MCLVGNALAYVGPNTSIITFFMPFFQQTFQAERATVSMGFMVATLLLTVGTLIGGRLVNKFGRKRLAAVMTVIGSFSSFMYMFSPSFELSLAFWWGACLFYGIAVSAYNSLALEQVPEYRGTMMSLSEVSQYVAQAIGSGVGGLILIVYGFSGLGWFSLTGIVGGLLYYFFTIDPTRLKTTKEPELVG